MTNLQSLSGGERSFVSVCLFMALCALEPAPMRIWDEFDVFMDEKVRQKCLELFASRFAELQEKELDQSHTQDNPFKMTQAVLITPHDVRWAVKLLFFFLFFFFKELLV